MTLVAAHPPPGGPPAPVAAWLTCSGATTAVVGALLLAACGRSPATRAVCWAAAAGVVNGLFAGLAKAVGVSWQSGWVTLLISWPLWALLLAAGVTLTLAAKAFQTGATAAAVTVLFAVEPLSGVAVGALLFGETMRHTPALLLVETLGVLVCLLGAALLARSPTILAAYAGSERAGCEPSTDVPAGMATTAQPTACSAVVDVSPLVR